MIQYNIFYVMVIELLVGYEINFFVVDIIFLVNRIYQKIV